MLQHEWILQTLCQVKEASHRGPYIVWLHVHEMFRIGEHIAIESRLVLLGAGDESKGMNVNGYRISFQIDENDLDLDGFTTLWTQYTKNYWIVNFKWVYILVYESYLNFKIFLKCKVLLFVFF